MTDPGKPRLPRRPELKPSDWSPRPIPQPVEPRRTADPPTPTLKELAERERRRASLVAQAPQDAPAVEPAALSSKTRTVRPLPGGSCDGGWAAVDAERARVLTSGGSTDNAIQRNGAISAAYAQYYQRNPGTEWAGLGAIVSRQARCAMEHARDVMGPANYDYYYRQLPDMQRHMPAFPQQAPTPGPVALGAMNAYDALAKTNQLIFSDIYPVLRFEEDYGLGALNSCGDSRPDGAVDPRVSRGIEQSRSSNPDVRRRGGGLLANYEQKEVLQKHVLDDWATREVFDLNQRMADTTPGRWLGAGKPEVALSANCNDGTPKVPFAGQFVDGDQRVAYYTGKLVPAFEQLQPSRLDGMITQIAGGR